MDEKYCDASDLNKCALANDTSKHIKAISNTIDSIIDKILPDIMRQNNDLMQTFVSSELATMEKKHKEERKEDMEETKGIYIKISEIKEYLEVTLRGPKDGDSPGLFETERSILGRVETLETKFKDMQEDRKFSIGNKITIALNLATIATMIVVSFVGK